MDELRERGVVPHRNPEPVLDRVRAVSPRPVCAGFGIRGPEQVAALSAHADGVVVGSRLIELAEAGEDVAAFVRGLHVQR